MFVPILTVGYGAHTKPQLSGLVDRGLISGNAKGEPDLPPQSDLSEVPLRHSVFFRNVHQHTYYSTALIAQGVVTWGDLMVEENARMIQSLLATWRPVYLRGRSLMTSIRPSSFDQPMQWYPLWGRGFFSPFLAPDLAYPC